jgi:hypothetical protein
MTHQQNPFEAMWNDYSRTWRGTFEHDGKGFDYSTLKNASRLKRRQSRSYADSESALQDGRCNHPPASS